MCTWICLKNQLHRHLQSGCVSAPSSPGLSWQCQWQNQQSLDSENFQHQWGKLHFTKRAGKHGHFLVAYSRTHSPNLSHKMHFLGVWWSYLHHYQCCSCEDAGWEPCGVSRWKNPSKTTKSNSWPNTTMPTNHRDSCIRTWKPQRSRLFTAVCYTYT